MNPSRWHSCPAGTFSAVAGLETWAGCRPCPAGTYTSTEGMSSCLECNGSSAHTCPVGSYQPSFVFGDKVSEMGLGGLSDLSSQDFPDANIQTWRTKKLVQTIQLIITGVGFGLFFVFLTALSVAALSHPKVSITHE